MGNDSKFYPITPKERAQARIQMASTRLDAAKERYKKAYKKQRRLYKSFHGEGKTKITRYNFESKKKEYLTALCESDSALQDVIEAKEYLFKTYLKFGDMTQQKGI